jgi:fructose-1,6-bisphosphatase/inositol monophosphatase family enzyme
MTNPSHESILLPELERQAAEAVTSGLRAAFGIHEELGEEGVGAVQENRFGDTALVADVRCEAEVLSSLKGMDAHVLVLSEEHGQVDINSDNESGIDLLGVLDGLDGSSLYKVARGVGRYGTMFALFANVNPSYNEYLAAGIMEHSTRRLYLATPSQGLSVTDVVTGDVSCPSTRDTREVSSDLVMFTDNSKVSPEDKLFDYFDQNDRVFAQPLGRLGVKALRTGSSAAYYAALAFGEADVVGEGTRKGNLELASAYAIVTAAGGVMQTLDGADLGPQRFRTFGQDEHVPILSAANAELADAVRSVL